MRVPILTYHAASISGADYANNQHVAFAKDLALVSERGWQIVPLRQIVDGLFDGVVDLPTRALGISFDDGSEFDAIDVIHPVHGYQRSMLGIMRDFAERRPAEQPTLHATSFVIASPEARECIYRRYQSQLEPGAQLRRATPGEARRTTWMSDDWWADGVASGLLGIGNHSWDHNHEALPAADEPMHRRGDFYCIDSVTLADLQIRKAAEFIETLAPNPAASLFCYPYGHVNAYLSNQYLPSLFESEDRFVRAAFGTQAGAVTSASNRWDVPRFVCGRDWQSPEELVAILDAVK